MGDAVHVADDPGLSQKKVNQCEGVLSRRWNAFRRALLDDPPARVEPLRAILKPGARAVKAYARTYVPVKKLSIVACTATLLALEQMFVNSQTILASPEMAVPKKGVDPFG